MNCVGQLSWGVMVIGKGKLHALNFRIPDEKKVVVNEKTDERIREKIGAGPTSSRGMWGSIACVL